MTLRRSRHALCFGTCQRRTRQRVIHRDRKRGEPPEAGGGNLDAYEGTSVDYWASQIEARLCADQEVVVVGAGNSAGQGIAAPASGRRGPVCARRRPRKRPCRAISSSAHLALANVEARPPAPACVLEGADGMLSAVHWHRAATGETVRTNPLASPLDHPIEAVPIEAFDAGQTAKIGGQYLRPVGGKS